MMGARSLFWGIAALSLLFFTGPAMADWKGHLTRLSDALTACRDLDSIECQPYMAAAVAIGDLLHEQSKVETVGGKDRILVPGATLSVWACDTSIYDRLNGQSLLHLAMATPPAEPQRVYWTQALRAAALQGCKPT